MTAPPAICGNVEIGDVFVAHEDGRFQCEPCARGSGVFELEGPWETWEVGGDGWLAPVVCDTCKLSIPVYVNGGEDGGDE